MKSNKNVKVVYDTLLHPKYDWRTISGIAKQTPLTDDEVRDCLTILIKNKKVRKSYVPDPWGRDLYGLIDRVDAEEMS